MSQINPAVQITINPHRFHHTKPLTYQPYHIHHTRKIYNPHIKNLQYVKTITRIHIHNTPVCRAYVLLYTMMFLLLITFFITLHRTSSAITLDRITNAHIAFQARLHLQSLEQIAKLCYPYPQLHSLVFQLDSSYMGGFDITPATQSTQIQNTTLINQQTHASIATPQTDIAYLYVEARNKRTKQTLRYTRNITLNTMP